MENKNFYLFTGAPGSGKSSVLNILKNKGYLTVKEAARDIIRNQLKTKGDALPWGDTVRYSNLMLLHSIVEFEEYVHIKEPCFSDRGIIDVLVYARLINIPVTGQPIRARKASSSLLCSLILTSGRQTLYEPICSLHGANGYRISYGPENIMLLAMIHALHRGALHHIAIIFLLHHICLQADSDAENRCIVHCSMHGI